MAGQGQRTGSDKRRITPAAARIMGYSSPDAMIKSPAYQKDVQRLEQRVANERKRSAAAGKNISPRQAVNNIYNRM